LNYVSINMSELNFEYCWCNILVSLLKLTPFEKEFKNI